jgi:hypothetical protein
MEIGVLDFIFYTNILTLLLPILLLSVKGKHHSKEFFWLMLLYLTSFIADVTGELFYQFRWANTNLASTAYNIISPALFGCFFYYSLRWPSWKWPITCATVIIFSIVNGVYFQKETINSFSAALLALYILFFCIVYFYKLLRELPADRIQTLPLFWIVSALFFIQSGKLVLQSVVHYMTTIRNDDLIVLWSIYNGLAIINNFITAYGVWLYLRSRDTSPVALNK